MGRFSFEAAFATRAGKYRFFGKKGDSDRARRFAKAVGKDGLKALLNSKSFGRRRSSIKAAIDRGEETEKDRALKERLHLASLGLADRNPSSIQNGTIKKRNTFSSVMRFLFLDHFEALQSILYGCAGGMFLVFILALRRTKNDKSRS